MPCEYQDLTGYGDYAWVCTETGAVFDTLEQCTAVCPGVTPPPPTGPTELTIFTSPSNVPLNGFVNVYGLLRHVETGVGLGEKTVRLYRKKPGEAEITYQRYVYTDLSGGYIFKENINVEGTWTFYVEFQGDAQLDPSKSLDANMEGYIPVGVSTALTINLDKKEFVPPGSLVISGELTRKDTGVGLAQKDVNVYWQKPGETFKMFATVTTISTGVYQAVTPMIYEEGVHEFYSEFVGDETFGACTSLAVSTKPPTPTLLDKLSEWWNSLSLWKKALVVGGTGGIVGGCILIKKGR